MMTVNVRRSHIEERHIKEISRKENYKLSKNEKKMVIPFHQQLHSTNRKENHG